MASAPRGACARGACGTAMPSNADTLPLLPGGNTGPDLIDAPCHFMSGDARELNARPQALFGEHVTVANTTCLHLDPHMSRLRLRNLALNDLKICSGTGNLRYFHRCYCNCCRCHNSSYEFSAAVESLLSRCFVLH